MKKRFHLLRLIALGTAVTITLSACGGGVVRLTGKDAGRTIAMRKGNTLEITLEGNPTTGYLWGIESVDTAVLKQAGDREYKRDSNAIGAGGKVTYRFEAVASGKTNLKLVYRRLWEHGIPPLEEFEVNVNVK